jgi:hypothetical protein
MDYNTISRADYEKWNLKTFELKKQKQNNATKAIYAFNYTILNPYFIFWIQNTFLTLT